MMFSLVSNMVTLLLCAPIPLEKLLTITDQEVVMHLFVLSTSQKPLIMLIIGSYSRS